jgi:hypothetical protein
MVIPMCGCCIKEMQTHFYTLAHNLSGEDAAEKVTSMLHEELTDEYSDDKGKWKPLTVWAAKGYDTARLLANCAAKDRKPDHVFGEVFRVRTLEDGVKKVTSFGFTSSMPRLQYQQAGRRLLPREPSPSLTAG